ncbi:hypothetical protein AB0P44_45435, partial [Streptomyces chartreusis]|uniref:hypothetical protein n=1 Tax=Streptomyces chartreusis TaxID=1969 RepID=UPI003418CF2A
VIRRLRTIAARARAPTTQTMINGHGFTPPPPTMHELDRGLHKGSPADHLSQKWARMTLLAEVPANRHQGIRMRGQGVAA